MNININFDGIPDAVRQAINKANMSEAEFADKTGVSQSVINRIVRRATIQIKLETFSRLWPFIGEYLIILP